MLLRRVGSEWRRPFALLDEADLIIAPQVVGVEQPSDIWASHVQATAAIQPPLDLIIAPQVVCAEQPSVIWTSHVQATAAVQPSMEPTSNSQACIAMEAAACGV